MKKGLNCLIIVAFLIAVQIIFISAAPTISPTSLSGNLNKNISFSITVSNADPSNITNVEIDIPSSLIFWTGSNSTSNSLTFTNSSIVLNWTNSSAGGLIGNSSSTLFSFVANATVAGSFNLTVKTALVNGSTSNTGFNLTIADSPPTISFVSPTPNDGTALSQNDIQVNVTAADDVGIGQIIIYLYSNTSSLINSSKSSTSPFFLDFISLSNGIYYLNATVNDTAGHLISTETRKITINATIISLCTENWTCANWSVCASGNQSRTCTDSKSCGTNSTKPSLIQACVTSAPLCIPDWQCVSWLPTDCPQNGTETRKCTDKNSCNDITAKPSESKTCTPQSSGSSWIFVVIILVLLVSGGAVALIFYFKNKTQEETYQPPSDSSQNGYANPQGYSYKYT